MADVMCLPVKKGFAMSSIPSKLPAYMFSAKPVLASVDAESDTARCIKDCNAGWVCEPENVEQIFNLMQKIVGLNKEELNIMGNSGREYAVKEFSRTENLKILANACQAIINKQ
jgi:glycosyltransferase involved in cell wall biosynthesis